MILKREHEPIPGVLLLVTIDQALGNELFRSKASNGCCPSQQILTLVLSKLQRRQP